MQLALPIILGAAIIIGLSLTVKVWADATLRSSASQNTGGLAAILTLPARLIAVAVLPGVNFIAHQLSKAAVHYMGPLAHWFNKLGFWYRSGADAEGDHAEATAHAIQRTTGHVIPREIGRKTRPIDRRAKRAGKIAVGAALSGAALRKAINQWRHHHVEPALRNLLHRTTVALPRAIGRIGAREKALSDRVANPSRAWVKRIGRRLWIVALAGLFVKFLAKKFPWLFCRKVSNVGKRLCGLDQDLLDSLLIGTLLVGGGMSIREFTHACQDVENVVVDALHVIIEEF